MEWLFLLAGVIVAAPLSGAVTYWRIRRRVLRAHRQAERARTRQHLVELARLTGRLAHEVKNPLSTIKLNLKLLAEEFEDSADDVHRRNHARLQRLQNEVQRVSDILDDFQRFAGQQEVHPVAVDLRHVVEELMDFYRPQAENSRVVLRAAMPEGPVVCNADVGLIKQALLNLMLNATQVMPEGGELLLHLNAQRDRAVLSVTDTGPGIPPDALPRLFEAYFTTRPGGTGLGLSTTQRIVRLHDGDIRVETEPGKGTRFIITLPLAGKK